MCDGGFYGAAPLGGTGPSEVFETDFGDEDLVAALDGARGHGFAIIGYLDVEGVVCADSRYGEHTQVFVQVA